VGIEEGQTGLAARQAFPVAGIRAMEIGWVGAPTGGARCGEGNAHNERGKKGQQGYDEKSSAADH
jgi:hypothetical protein